MADKIANGESATILPLIKADFAKNDVKELVKTKVERIEADGKRVIAVNTENNSEVVINCDKTVMAVGSVKNTLDAEGINVPVLYVGDCSGERTASIAEAIRSGYTAANSI